MDCKILLNYLFVKTRNLTFVRQEDLEYSCYSSTRTEDAAGYDIASAEETVVPAKGKTVVKTGISIAVPDGCYGRLAPRSGLAVRKYIDVGAGVIDADYRGEIGVVLFKPF